MAYDYKKAAFWFQKAAEQGHADAQYLLGECYKLGIGVPKSDSKAWFWYQESAEKGHSDAQSELDNLYKKYQKSAEQQQKMAEQGNIDAQYLLGKCYKFGILVKKDYEKAAYWLQKAAEQGHADAQYLLGRSNKSGSDILKNDDILHDVVDTVSQIIPLKKIFISHSSKDSEICMKLCERLEKIGLPCWIAPRDISCGETWAGEIAKNLMTNTWLFIFLLSENSNKSKQVLKEINIAINYHIPMLIITIQHVETMNYDLSYYLSNLHINECYKEQETTALEEMINLVLKKRNELIPK